MLENLITCKKNMLRCQLSFYNARDFARTDETMTTQTVKQFQFGTT